MATTTTNRTDIYTTVTNQDLIAISAASASAMKALRLRSW